MYCLMKEQSISLTDEGIHTFCEVENIINSRPLTETSNAVSDLEPLTPNHILLLNGGVNNPGDFDKDDTYVK